MPHQTPNPHDAEEALRPTLGALHEAIEVCRKAPPWSWPAPWEMKAERDAALAALDKALELLGVQR